MLTPGPYRIGSTITINKTAFVPGNQNATGSLIAIQGTGGTVKIGPAVVEKGR
jgi:hypothetical protein